MPPPPVGLFQKIIVLVPCATLPLPWPCPGLIRTKKKDGTLEGWEKDGTLVVSVEVIGSGGPRLL